MNNNIRELFVTEMINTLSKNSCNVTPTEIGVLRNRYKTIYDSTPSHLRPRIFEQLLCSVEIYLTLSEELYKNNNPAFMKLVLKTSEDLRLLIKEYLSAFDHGVEK